MQAAILVLEAGGYSLNTDGIEYGIVKGDKPYDGVTTALAGAGRFELSFLITESNGKTKVTLQPSSYRQNAFGVESQNSYSGSNIQEAVDKAFASFNEMIGGGDLGSIASIKAEEINTSKMLPCNDTQANRTMIVVGSKTPLLESRLHGASHLLELNSGVRVHVYSVTDNFATVCYEDKKAYIKASRVGTPSSDL